MSDLVQPGNAVKASASQANAAEERCSCCERAKSELKCLLDVYNNFGDYPGDLICDDCVFAAADPGPTCVVMPYRPEGYYHCAPGTFD